MLEQNSKTFTEEFKKKFLLKFTKELIKNSVPKEIFELQKVIKKEVQEQRKEIKEEKKKIKEIIHKNKEPLSILKEDISLNKKQFKPLPINKPMILTIPEPRLPPEFQYLKPIPTGREIDLGKLNPLVQDPAVRIIECNTPDESIIVTGNMGRKTTRIILTKEEINEVIKKFSKTSKIPVYEGIFRVVVGRLILLAIISEVVGSKFIIKKMMFSPNMNFRR
ncbi:hypothetical protein KAJ87_04070 [Candidatus Pacearchaeota archaeon]|nr:hypothetical protein [Candidatus Pacearchaeota archaeon]